MKRLICLLLCLMALPLWAGGEEVFPPREYEFTHKAYRQYDSTTLKYKMETFKIQGVRCYLTKVWLWDPGKQIRKVTSEWRKNIMLPRHMAEHLYMFAGESTPVTFRAKKYILNDIITID